MPSVVRRGTTKEVVQDALVRVRLLTRERHPRPVDSTVVGDATVPKRVGRGRVEALEGAYVVDGAANVHPAFGVGRAEPIVPIGEEPSKRPGCEARHPRQARRNQHRRPEQENAPVDPVVASARA